MPLIATPVQVLEAIEAGRRLKDEFKCNGEDAVLAKVRLQKARLIVNKYGDGFVLTQKGRDILFAHENRAALEAAQAGA